MSTAATFTVFLASIPKDEDIYFRTLDERTQYYAAGLVSGRPISGHATLFTARSEGSQCIVEWVDDGPSPLEGGAKHARLAHGQRFAVGTTTYLVYAEDSERRLSSRSPAGMNDDTPLSVIEALDPVELQATLLRFIRLPYVAKALAHEFAERTAFVQYRDGRVPRVRAINYLPTVVGRSLRIEIAVRSLFTGTWSDPSLIVERALGPEEIDDIAACSTKLSVIPTDV